MKNDSTASIYLVYFVSLGCSKNLVDSQVMLGSLVKDHYRITQEPENADVIIINTCSFIQAAQEESLEVIFEMAQWKETGQCKVLVVAGCLSQRYAVELEKSLTEVDLFIGTGEYHRITEFLQAERDRWVTNSTAVFKRSYVNQPAFIHTEKNLRIQTGSPYSAFLKISEGCNRRCSFCVIPSIRGSVRSRTIQSLVIESKALVASGVRELNLIAQDLTEYGMEWKYQERLEMLLPQLCAIQGLDWIRLHYVYPDQFSDELIQIVASEPKIVKYLDMPIQHTHDRILKAMNRRLTQAQLFALVQKLRSAIPELVFRTSIIVGFPGETEDEFQALCEDLKVLDLDHVGVFRYSAEKGTPAAKLANPVHWKTKRKREQTLLKLVQQQSLEKHQKKIGQVVPVLVEGFSSETQALIQGRMAGQAQEIDGHVFINDVGSRLLTPGDLIEVELTEALPHDFIGRCTPSPTDCRPFP